MRKLIVLSAIVLLFAASGSFAQKYTRAITIDPLDFLVSKVINVTYEQMLSEKNSFTIFASYYAYSGDWSAYGIGGSYRWYLPGVLDDGKSPYEGLSVGPMARVSFWDYTGPNPLGTDYGGSYVVLGGEAAYKFVFDRWVVEPILRLGFGVTELDGLGYSGWGGGVNIGYAF